MTLGDAAGAQVRLIVWCKACQHQVEPDPAEMATRYGAGTSVLVWRGRLTQERGWSDHSLVRNTIAKSETTAVRLQKACMA